MLESFKLEDPYKVAESLDPKPLMLGTIAFSPVSAEVTKQSIICAIEDGTILDVAELLPPVFIASNIARLVSWCLSGHKDSAVLIRERFLVPSKLISLLSKRFAEVIKTSQGFPLVAACPEPAIDEPTEDSGEGDAVAPSASGRKSGKKTPPPKQPRKGAKKSPSPAIAKDEFRVEVAALIREWLGEQVDEETALLLADIMRREVEELCIVAKRAAASEKAQAALSKSQQQGEALLAAFVDSCLALEAMVGIPEADRMPIEKHVQRNALGELVLCLAKARAIALGIPMTDDSKDGDKDPMQRAAQLITCIPAASRGQLAKLPDLAAKDSEQLLDEVMDIGKDYGFKLRRPDRTRSRERVLQHVNTLKAQLESEKRPPAALHMAAMLLHIRATGKFLPAPPRSVHVLIGRLEGNTSTEKLAFLRDFQQRVVSFLRAGATAAGSDIEKTLTRDLDKLRALAFEDLPR
jgi:hypothetical protein